MNIEDSAAYAKLGQQQARIYGSAGGLAQAYATDADADAEPCEEPGVRDVLERALLSLEALGNLLGDVSHRVVGPAPVVPTGANAAGGPTSRISVREGAIRAERLADHALRATQEIYRAL